MMCCVFLVVFAVEGVSTERKRATCGPVAVCFMALYYMAQHVFGDLLVTAFLFCCVNALRIRDNKITPIFFFFLTDFVLLFFRLISK